MDPLLPHFRQALVDVHAALGGNLLQHGVQEDEGPGPAHPCTAVDQHGGLRAVVLSQTTDEGDECSGKLGHSVIWPAEELEVLHL